MIVTVTDDEMALMRIEVERFTRSFLDRAITPSVSGQFEAGIKAIAERFHPCLVAMASFVGSHADLFVGWPDDPEIPDWASDRLFGPRPVKPPFFSDEAHQDAVEKWSVRRDQTIADILAGRMR